MRQSVGKNLSRQQLWQQRKRRQGRCITCGKGPLETANHCKIHAEANRVRALARYHAKREAGEI